VLALKLGLDHVDGGTTVGGSNNFVTFFDGTDSVLGEIQGNDTGGVAYVSGNADFAEWLRRLDVGETLEAGDVVGLYGDAVSRRTAGATRVFVVSTAPIVLGNDPGATERASHARIALLGQAPVKVRGPIHAGDLLVASGRGDGVATGRAPDELSPGEVSAVVGRALEAAEGTGTRLVPALVGLDVAIASLPGRALESALARIERRIDRLEACISAGETTATGARARSRSR
jgi:hypothetical protein